MPNWRRKIIILWSHFATSSYLSSYEDILNNLIHLLRVLILRKVFMKENNYDLILTNNIESIIYNIRGVQVMLDSDIAYLFNVETRLINQ